MSMRLQRWIRSNDVASTALTPSSMVPLAAQSRDDPEPYSAPATMTSGTPSSRVGDRRVVDAQLLAAGQVAGEAALDIGHKLVTQSDVGERAADHHLVVAAPGSVGVEVAGATPCSIR